MHLQLNQNINWIIMHDSLYIDVYLYTHQKLLFECEKCCHEKNRFLFSQLQCCGFNKSLNFNSSRKIVMCTFFRKEMPAVMQFSENMQLRKNSVKSYSIFFAIRDKKLSLSCISIQWQTLESHLN
jgi:hypothetical protein